jgi:hypothetical protein
LTVPISKIQKLKSESKTQRPSKLSDNALLLFYAVVVFTAMCGWLYFLGQLTWKVGGWILSALT